MSKKFPRTTVGGVSVSRMIIGTNWLCGWSHTSVASDKMIEDFHCSHKNIDPILDACLEHDIDTIMGPFEKTPHVNKALDIAREKYNRDLILVDTPFINVDDNADARKEAEASIKACKARGSTFCLIHHSCVEQLVNKNKRTIERLGDYTDMIRNAGLIPGLSAHMPELIVYSDENGYDVETYIQIYNCMGFLMQVEIESVSRIIHNAKKPVMTIKSMAAGRCSPYVGLNFSWATLRECDMVTVGCLTAREMREDIEISFAAFEKRYPDMDARQSPNQNQAAFGK